MQSLRDLMTRAWHWVSSRVPYLFLLRVQLLTLVALVALPYLAFCTSASEYLLNLFDVQRASAWIVSLTALGAAWTTLFTISLVVQDAPVRMRIEPLGILAQLRPRHFVLFGLLALPASAGVYVQTTHGGTPQRLTLIASLGLGAVLACFLLWNAGRLALFFHRRVLAHGLRLIPDVLLTSTASWLLAHPERGSGILEYDSNDQRAGLSLIANHRRALAFLVVSLLLYGAIGILKAIYLGKPANIPALACVYLLLTLVCWGLAGLAFWADRYRIPLLLLLALLCLVTALCPLSDHYFRDPEGTKLQQLLPKDVLGAAGRTSVIVVAASGGGIQAAAWTARVLTGLEEQARAECTGCEDFGKSVRLISSVSGGSVGTMYFLNAYSGGLLPDHDGLKGVVERAEKSSLDEVAWGLVYPDLARAVVPGFPFKHADRGWALEQSFIKRDRNLDQGLSTWRESVSKGDRPAVIFNAAIAETGERLLLATTDLEGGSHALKSFYDRYGGRDLAIATAARLSATFPYVSPASRADTGTLGNHIVDGGYYDNYGVSSLVEWLIQALKPPENSVKHILVIEIRSKASAEPSEKNTYRGSLYQVYAPIATMLNVRDAAQIANGAVELDLLTRANFPSKPSIYRACFQFEEGEPPHSWHLTPSNIQAIDSDWRKRAAKSKDWETVHNFLAGSWDKLIPEDDPCSRSEMGTTTGGPIRPAGGS